ncbi:retrovirus-related pol polyprotein from transposon TNT 1-94 [Tanacetum coccineum]|uniref:Retrovirus-related pol polyprotein from transposon TNT 1-94 n=1 Tax=Tanacetum coccineum TaxID=301880 RepID=A0ABQ5DAP0_9ASTR
MANLSEDIQCAGSDTRPPMLDRSDFESWQQRIRLYCLGKKNGENILQSIDECPFKMGKFRETLAEGALHLGPERDRVFADLTPEEKERFKTDIRATNILLQGLPKDIYTLINHYTDAKDIWDNVKMLLEGSELTKDKRESQLYDDFEHFRKNKEQDDVGNIQSNSIDPLTFVSNISPQQYPTQSSAIPQSAYVPPVTHQPQFADNTQLDSEQRSGEQCKGSSAAGNGGFQNRVGNANPGQAKPIKCYNYNGIGHIARQCTHPKRPQNSEYFKDKMLLMQAQENGVVLDEEQLLFIAADQCDAFDSDVDEAPTTQTMFMANLSSADSIYDEAGPLYDSDILSKVQDHDIDSVGKYHEVHEMQNDVQQNYVVDSDAEYMSDSNIIPYEQYVKDNAVQVVQSNLSSVPNDALMMIINDMHEHAVQCVSANEHNKVVNESLTAELADIRNKSRFMKKGQEEGSNRLQNPLYLTGVMQVQSAIYNGHEIVKTNHASAVVHDLEDTLEIAKITRKKMLEKMKSPMWIEAEVEQNDVDKRCADIERKNLLNENENLIADCLSNELLYSVMNDVNTASRYSEMHGAYTVEQARCLELEAEISKLKYKIQKDDHSEMIKRFSNLEIEHLNLQLKYQNLKEHRIFNFKALDSQNIELKEHVTALQEQNEHFRTENEKVNQHYKELYDSIKITRAKTIENTSSLLTENGKLKAQLKGKMQCVTMPAVKPKVLTPGMYAIDVEPILLRDKNNRVVHLDYLKHLKESVETLREIVEEARIEKPLDNTLENACFYTKRSQELYM